MLRTVLRRESSNFCLPQFYYFILVPTLITIVYICFTGLIPPVSVARCSEGYWALFGSFIALMAIVAYFCVVFIKKDYETKVRVGYKFH